MEKKKTITLGPDEDNPSVSFCLGHVTAKEFNKAWQAEGWTGGDRILSDELHYLFGLQNSDEWKFVDDPVKGAVEVTVLYW